MNEQAYKAWDDMNSEVRDDFEFKYKAYWINHFNNDREFFNDHMAEAYENDQIFDIYKEDGEGFWEVVHSFIDAKAKVEAGFLTSQALNSWSEAEMKDWLNGKRIVEEDKPKLYANAYIRSL